MFRTVPLSIIKSFSLYSQQWYMSYRFAGTLRAGSGRNCSSVLILLASYQLCVYSSQHNDVKHNKTIYSFIQAVLLCNNIICHRHNIIPLEVICLPHTIPNAIWKLEVQFLNFL